MIFEAPDKQSLLRKAKSLADAGRLDEAYEIIVALTLQHTTNSIANLSSAWAEMLLGRLRKRFSNKDAYPQRLTNIGEIRRYRLKSREAFLLGLVDGTTTIDELIAISPVDELDTLRALAHLIDLGLLGIGPYA